MRKIGIVGYKIGLLFSFLGILFIPFSFRYLYVQPILTKFLFQDLIVWFASHFETIYIANPEISSDSTTCYLLLLLLFFIACILTISLSFINIWKNNQRLIFQAIQLVLVGYLSLVMFKYGFDKLFKAQFYLPEPNTLFTPLGMLDKDLLFWSTMGVSHTYSVFLGIAELIPASLLLFSRTRILGLCILFGVLIHIVLINFGFDISVKLYSIFLLFVCCLLLVPSIHTLIQFFLLNKPAILIRLSGTNIIHSKIIRYVLKAILILLFFFEALLSYISTGHYNDDHIPRNYLHGAYEIIKVETENANENLVTMKIKQFFVHRHNYFIFQYEDNSMEDFYLEILPNKNQFILTNDEGEKFTVHYAYSKSPNNLKLTFVELKITIYSKALPWEDMPLLQPLFHWTVDSVH